ncbi:DNA-directed RNA polymerase III subunit RPC3 [[Candida] anglica]|uniref:DNA-directed RNA polymerase III subunit RPC3 n=1 Tax=[Candida] anglica TaxID=148631 RepID=A0ABP0ECQ7_9ASCO
MTYNSDVAATQSPKSYLLTSIARTHLGEVASIIVSSLISHGRLTCHELSTRCKLPIKTVKSALVSLIQLNCIYYWKDSSSGKNGVVHYSLNERGLLVFVHSGDIINYIDTKYGAESAEIIQNVIQMGHVRVQDYLSGTKEGEDLYEQQNRLFKLFVDGWLCRIQPFNFNPIQDLWSKLYEECLKQIPRSATTSEIKRVNEAKEKTKIRLAELFESGLESKDLYEMDGGIKKLRPTIVVAFNLTRFEKRLRSRSLVNLAKSRIGTLSAAVYEAALTEIEHKSPDLRHYFLTIPGLINDPEEERLLMHSIENKLVDQRRTTFNARDLTKYLGEIDLKGSILSHNFFKSKRVAPGSASAGAKRIKTEDGSYVNVEQDEVDELIVDDSHFSNFDIQDQQSLIADHLKLLASSSSINFLIETSPGTFTIPYTQLIKDLKQTTFDTLIKSSLGLDAFKILRTLRGLKLADEKSIANSILLKEKTVRNEICKLIEINAVELQEVPRSADRAASKTFFLFRHKSYISYQYLSNSLLFNMSQVLTNIENFKLDHKILLEKCEREDVKGNEEQLLLDSELKTLRDLQLREVKNIGKFNRLKSLHDIFGVF